MHTQALSRRQALASLALVLTAPAALAQGGQPIRLIVGVPPGSSTDVVARVMAEAVGKILGQTVIVENRPGGSGSIATSAFLNSPHDGQNWLLAVNGFFSEAPHSVKLSFDPLKDARPLVELGGGGPVLVVNAASPIKSVRELAIWARANPGKASYASFSAGSVSHVLGLMLNKSEGLDMLHVPYKGSPPALQDLMGDSVQLMFDAPPSSLPLIRAGKLRALAVTSAQRMDVLPDVPTLAELGYRDMTRLSWLGVWTTPDAPAAAQQRMRAAMLQALEQAPVRQRFAELGFVIHAGAPLAPEQLAQRLAAEYAAIGATLRSINYRPE
jgi:tripartite-type tricarboxylate transporter receptor subunit TctC